MKWRVVLVMLNSMCSGWVAAQLFYVLIAPPQINWLIVSLIFIGFLATVLGSYVITVQTISYARAVAVLEVKRLYDQIYPPVTLTETTSNGAVDHKTLSTEDNFNGEV